MAGTWRILGFDVSYESRGGVWSRRAKLLDAGWITGVLAFVFLAYDDYLGIYTERWD